MHVAVIGVLLLSPGCKTTSSNVDSDETASTVVDSRSASGSSAAVEPDSSLDPAFNAGFSDDPNALPSDSSAPRIVQTNSSGTAPRQPPTRPKEAFYGSDTMLEQPEETMSAAAAPVRIQQVSDPMELEAPKPQESTLQYTVQSGDSFWKISRKFDVSLDTLLAANNMTRNSVIRPGQVLVIPGVSAPASSSASPIASSSVSTRKSVSGMTYTVLPGDTLSEIAKVHNVSVEALRLVNGISGNRIIAGQDLILPEGAVMPELKVKTSAPSSRVARVPAGAIRDGLTHKVVPGDTLSGIAKKYGVSVKHVQDLNGISDPRKLSVGKVLLIKLPEETSRAPATTTTRTIETRETGEIMFEDEAPPETVLRRMEDNKE